MLKSKIQNIEKKYVQKLDENEQDYKENLVLLEEKIKKL